MLIKCVEITSERHVACHCEVSKISYYVPNGVGMKLTTIEQSATRLFDARVKFVKNCSLKELHIILEEAYKLHERLKLVPGKKSGLHNIAEFQFLKSLRNYSVHTGDFLGEVYTYDPEKLTPELMLFHINLHQLCLINKNEVKRAINSEKPLLNYAQEQAKIEAINSQLIPYGDYYDLEPVVFNFIAKLYEELLPLRLSISGEGYAIVRDSYNEETLAGMSHYVPVKPIPFDCDNFMENLVPLESEFYETRDEFEDVATSGLNYSGYNLLQTEVLPDFEYLADNDKLWAMNLICRSPKFVELAACLPHHIGAAIILDDGMKEINVKPFNIKQELAGLQQHNIQIDDKFLPTHDGAVLILVCITGKENQITPNLIHKDELISVYEAVQSDFEENKAVHKQDIRLSQSLSNKEKHKKAKNKKRQAAAKARKRNRK